MVVRQLTLVIISDAIFMVAVYGAAKKKKKEKSWGSGKEIKTNKQTNTDTPTK